MGHEGAGRQGIREVGAPSETDWHGVMGVKRGCGQGITKDGIKEGQRAAVSMEGGLGGWKAAGHQRGTWKLESCRQTERDGGALNHRSTWELWTVAGDEEFTP